MQLVDTHCHIHEAQTSSGDDPSRNLWLKAGKTNADAIIESALEKGVARMICVGTTAEDSELAVKFVQNRPNCWASVGLHPHDAKDREKALAKISKLLSADNKKIVAIGECGLDYFYNNSPKEDQFLALRAQIELALEHDLPLIFHVRSAFDDFWPIFDSYKNIRGVLHSFTDSWQNLEKALDRGLFIGANGIMTFTKDQSQLEMIKSVPLQKLLIETDAPFLTPHPFRGNVNEPAHASLVADFLAQIRSESIQDLAAQTTANAQTLFNL